jgi:hypothetical protein
LGFIWICLSGFKFELDFKFESLENRVEINRRPLYPFRGPPTSLSAHAPPASSRPTGQLTPGVRRSHAGPTSQAAMSPLSSSSFSPFRRLLSQPRRAAVESRLCGHGRWRWMASMCRRAYLVVRPTYLSLYEAPRAPKANPSQLGIHSLIRHR